MRHEKRLTVLLLAFAMVVAAGCQRAEGRGARDKQDAADAPPPITLPAGTTISIRIADAVNSNHNHDGDLLTGMVDPSVFVGNHVVIPRGTEAHIRVMENKKGGHLGGKAAVRLELVGLVINDEKLDVDTNQYKKQQGSLSAKLKGTGAASASAGGSAVTSPNPATAAAGPIIAVFRAAKVEIAAGTRVPFKLTAPFTFGQSEEASTRP